MFHFLAFSSYLGLVFNLTKSRPKPKIVYENKEERYSRVPRLSDTRYSKGNGDMQAPKRD